MDESEQNKTIVLGLLFNCPKTQSNNCQCPLYNLRNQLTHKEFMTYVESLSDSQIQNIIYCHKHCSKCR